MVLSGLAIWIFRKLSYVRNMKNHKFSHSDISYRFSGGNVNIILEFTFAKNDIDMYTYVFSEFVN